MSDYTICLSQAAVGQPLRLLRINAGRKLSHRLTELGVTPGVELRIVQEAGGTLILAVRGSRVAVGRGMAEKMQVVATSEEKSY